MLDYFMSTYNMKIQNVNQPLFEIKQKRQNIFLPPELCTLVGIPPKVRENKRMMAELRQSLFQQPDQRIDSIKMINQKISESKELLDWKIDLRLDPDQLEANILKRPEIYDPQSKEDRGRSMEDTNVLRSVVHQPIHFSKWGIFCLDRDVEHAKYIQEKFYGICEQRGLKIYVDYGDIIHLRDRATIDDFKAAFDSYYQKQVEPERAKGSKDLHFFFVIMPDSIRQDLFYANLKNKINQDTSVISQFVCARTLLKDNDRIYMNIIRQINAKLGGDLWRMKFDKEISKKTMLVGIDVCHKGKQSIIGFCASYDSFLCKYYTQASPQERKGKEIISNAVLSEYFKNSFKAYKDFNKGELPDHIFVYRDGVGDSMRAQVIKEELEQLKRIIEEVYGSESPHITLIIVNKRVRQRFFEIKQAGRIYNPPQGTFVDSGFVEQSQIVEGKFDFFLIPHAVTQGSVKPTHFYVAENSSKVSKNAILNFTYALCYNYYNWPDSIKIPAPCMLADKIAIYRNEIGSIPRNVDLHKLPFYL